MQARVDWPALLKVLHLTVSVRIQVEWTRWVGKDLYNTGPCSQMIVLCVYAVGTRLMSSEDKNFCCKCQLAFCVD